MLSKIAWAALTTLGVASCNTFVLHEEPVAPEPAPFTRVDVAGADTTYVLRTTTYALLSRERRLLWTRSTIDDAAHRFHALLGAQPPAIAVRVDTSASATAGEWDGLPLVAVRAAPLSRKRVTPGEELAHAAPQVASRVASAWVRTLAVPAAAWWFELGATQLVADADARGAAVSQASNAGDRTSLITLLATPRPAVDEMGVVATAIRTNDEQLRVGNVGNVGTAANDGYGSTSTARRDRLPSYRGPLALAQATSLLLFLRDRDSAFVAALPAQLRAGATLPGLLAQSTALPHTVDAFDAEWRKWLRARASGRTLQAPNGARAGG